MFQNLFLWVKANLHKLYLTELISVQVLINFAI